MNERIDVLAVMDRHVSSAAANIPDGGQDLCGSTGANAIKEPSVRARVEAIHNAARERHAEAVEARAAVAELIEADKEYDAAYECEWRSPAPPAVVARRKAAATRRAAALARVQGGAA